MNGASRGLHAPGGRGPSWFHSVGAAVATIAAVVVIGAVVSGWLYSGPGPAARQGAQTTVILRKGAGIAEIGADLKRAGVIRSAPIFMAAAQITGAAHALKAGEYAFPTRASLAAVIRKIRRGEVVHHRITIPEGLTSAQVAAILMHSDVLSGAVEVPPEGSVLPETYEVVRGESREAVLKRMMAARDKLLAALWAKRKPGLPFEDPEQAVTLASIVEKETALPAERPMVAAVYINRLRQGMKLDADPTVIYAVSGGAPLGHPIRQSELMTLSPYNTYLVVGLPPTPIGNPGRASLAAVLDPADTDALYFVANGTGGHVFAKTLDEQSKNVQRWRALEAQRQAQAAVLAGAPAAFSPVQHR